ncbi:MAG: hypothetical protein P1V20_19540 [Verrucomicrobiales bacterium]|nr:hypothetical protein [Verrucomicrobiales bacterium]
MSSTEHKKEENEICDQVIIRNQFALSRFFRDKTDESRIRSRALNSLLFLCPEVARDRIEGTTNPEGIN